MKPILSDRCYHCHGPDADNQNSELRLDSRENATADLGGITAIKPGDVAQSELHVRIHSTGDNQMPPADSNRVLSAEEKEILDAWIAAGAPFDKHWSLKPIPKAINSPDVGSSWGHNAIDPFVASKLARRGISPSKEALRERLIRRVTFALTGLPPTLTEIDAFLDDKQPAAYERVVDRLLASPRFGERMAVDWLDLARYADTYGYQEDRYRDMWPWRDWVVRSFNENMPFDKFITWQLAGDLLPIPTDEQVMATAFNRLHRQTSEGGSIEEEFRNEYVVDRVDTFGAAFLGLTVGCARCHDHKFDPISQKDYYQFSAFFNNIDESGLYPFFTSSVPTPTLTLASDVDKKSLRKLKQAITLAEAKLIEVRNTRRDAFQKWLKSQPIDTQLTGLIGDFTFDDTSEASKNEIPNRVDPEEVGELKENPKLVAGKPGKALLFNGENNFNTAVGGDFRRYDPFTIGLWIKTPDVKQRAVIWHRTRAPIDAGSRGYQLLVEDGKLTASVIHFWPGNAALIRTKQTLPIDQWVHVTVTYDGSSSAKGLRVYWDGQRVDSEVVRDGLTRRIDYAGESNIVDSDKVASIAHRLAVGQRFRDRGFIGGGADELTVFDRELGEAEIVALLDRTAIGPGYFQRLVEKREARTEKEEEQLYEYYLRNHDPAVAAQAHALREARRVHAEKYDSIPEVMVMQEMPSKRPTFVLERGSYDALGESVDAITPDWLPPMEEKWPNNRLGLTRWLTDSSHPLTSRVTVNRFWQSLFGNGLVSTPLDFGSQGGRPSHPELLDWLARDFIDSGWDVKHLVKRIVMSATYRQSSESDEESRTRDPQNRLLARGPRHRLSAEEIRDSALFTSNLLEPRIGGPPVKPYQPDGLWAEKGWGSYQRDQGAGSHRRSLYTYWKRTSPPPSMMTLDSPDREVCVAERQSTATPLQPLVLLNDPQYVEAARALAASLLDETSNDIEMAIQLAYRKCTSRKPTANEVEILSKLYIDQLDLFRSSPERVAEFLGVGDQVPDKTLNANSLAALTVTVEVVMNLNEAITVR